MTRKIIFILLLAGISFTYFSQEKNTGAAERLKQMFQFAASNNVEPAYKFVAVAVDQQSKKYQPVDLKNSAHLRIAKRLIRRISNYIKISDSYEFKKAATKSGITVVPVVFVSKGKKMEVHFEFISINDAHYLFDID